jgi:hypothetical protein
MTDEQQLLPSQVKGKKRGRMEGEGNKRWLSKIQEQKQ